MIIDLRLDLEVYEDLSDEQVINSLLDGIDSSVYSESSDLICARIETIYAKKIEYDVVDCRD